MLVQLEVEQLGTVVIPWIDVIMLVCIIRMRHVLSIRLLCTCLELPGWIGDVASSFCDYSIVDVAILFMCFYFRVYSACPLHLWEVEASACCSIFG